MTDEQPKYEYVSNQMLQLELKALRSDFKTWLVGAVVVNSALSHVALPSVIGIAGTALAIFAVALKVTLFR